MLPFMLAAFAAAKVRGYRIAPVWKDWSLYPFYVVELLYWVFQGFTFAGHLIFIPYSGALQSAYTLSMLVPILRHQLYLPAILGTAMVGVGTAANKWVIAANAGRMPVWPTFSRLTGYFNPLALDGGFDTVHVLMGKETALSFLGDYIDLGFSIMSPGDLFIHGFIAIILYGVIRHHHQVDREAV